MLKVQRTLPYRLALQAQIGLGNADAFSSPLNGPTFVAQVGARD